MASLALRLDHHRQPATPRPDSEQRPWWQGSHGFNHLLTPEMFAERVAQVEASRDIVWIGDPHPAQQQLLDSQKRFIAACCGRRWGKTFAAIRWLAREAERTQETCWWIAPTYQTCMQAGWAEMIRNLPRKYRVIKKAERRVELSCGGAIEFKSADQPDNLRGMTLGAVVCDEAAWIDDYVWFEVLQPMLATLEGRGLFISTPRGKRGFFYDFHRMGMDGDEAFAGFHFPSSSNPFLKPSEIALQERLMPTIAFQREWLAQFVDGQDNPLDGIKDVATATRQDKPIAGRRYIAGIDWGRQNDFTVISIMEELGDGRARQVDLERFTGIRFRAQQERVAAKLVQWGVASVIAETNNFGAPLVEWLEDVGFPVEPWTMGANKAELVDQFQLAIEQQWVEVLNDPILIAECQNYEESETSTGRRSFSAPPRQHDDTVVATALSLRGALGAPGGERGGHFDGKLEDWLDTATYVPGMPELPMMRLAPFDRLRTSLRQAQDSVVEPDGWGGWRLAA